MFSDWDSDFKVREISCNVYSQEELLAAPEEAEKKMVFHLRWKKEKKGKAK